MIDLIVAAVVITILGLAIGYIVRAKRRGVKCIGCSACSSLSHTASSNPCSGSCSGCSSSCGCGSELDL